MPIVDTFIFENVYVAVDKYHSLIEDKDSRLEVYASPPDADDAPYDALEVKCVLIDEEQLERLYARIKELEKGQRSSSGNRGTCVNCGSTNIKTTFTGSPCELQEPLAYCLDCGSERICRLRDC